MNPATRIACRFLFLYFALFFLTDRLVALLPFGDAFIRVYSELWNPALVWVGEEILHLPYEIGLVEGGINNTAYGWTLFLCYVALAAVGTVIWSVLDRRRTEYRRPYQWLRLLLRCSLAAAMIYYGMIKLIPSQMIAPPPLGVLMFRVGDLLPNYLLWWFVGSSPAYESFTGLAELVGGVLLLFPRTTLLGALVCAANMLTVFMLNMCYDVIVKLYSLHLLVMALLLVAPDLRRLADLFLLNRRVEPAEAPPLFARKRLDRAPHVLLFLFGLYTIGRSLEDAVERYRRVNPPRPPLYGIWSVEELAVDGREVPLFTDPDRWRWVRFQNPGAVGVELMIGSSVGYALDLDMAGKTMTLGKVEQDAAGNPRKVPGWQAELSFEQPEADLLLLDGQLDGRRIEAKLRLMPLLARRFHWVLDPPEE